MQQPILLVVSERPGVAEQLTADLRRRLGADYDVHAGTTLSPGARIEALRERPRCVGCPSVDWTCGPKTRK